MKIRTSTQRGSLTLAMVIIVATIAVVCVGGYMVYKMQKKVDAINANVLQQMTNDVDDVAAQMVGESPGSFALTSITVVTQQVGVATRWVVETSTNLTDWETLLQTDDPAEADSEVTSQLQSGTDPVRFFRTLTRP